MNRLLRQLAILALAAAAPAQASAAAASGAGGSASGLHRVKPLAQAPATAPAKPRPAPARWRGLIGEYGPDDGILYILEKDGRLYAQPKGGRPTPLTEVSNNIFKARV